MGFTTWPIKSYSKLRLGINFSIRKSTIAINHELSSWTYGMKSKLMLSDREKCPQVWKGWQNPCCLSFMHKLCNISSSPDGRSKVGFRKWKNGDALTLRGVHKWLKMFQRKNKNGMIWGSLCPMSEWVSEVAQSCLTLCHPMDSSLHQAPSMGFSRQEDSGALPFPSLPYGLDK